MIWPFKPRAKPAQLWISFYRDPRSGRESYLCKSAKDDGYYYSPYVSDAVKFVDKAEAVAITPTYDGSADIEHRAGVMLVK